MLRVVNGVENVLPTPLRLVALPVRQGYFRNEVVGYMSILVESDLATFTLREECEGYAGEFRASEPAGPAALAGDVVEVELDVDLRVAVDGPVVVVEDVEPGVDLLAGEEMGDGDVGAADELGPDGVVDFDGEDYLGGHVGAVDVEGLVPTGVGVLVFEETSAADPGLSEVDRGVEL